MNADSADLVAPNSSTSLSDSLAASARLAWGIAPDNCLPADELFPGCADYHGLYPLLHAVGLAATPDRHAEFYARELGTIAATGDYPAVLVSGSADQGMLEHVDRAYAGNRLELDMLDLCPTPGKLCEAWAERAGLHIRTHACNVLEWFPDRPYDLITTHSFIAKFGPDTRGDLFAAWSRFLRPGGKLITTTRIDPTELSGDAGFDASRAAAFARELAAAVEPWREYLGIDSAQLDAVARRHCNGIKSYAVPSVGELRRLLETNGFAVDSIDLVVHRGKLKAGQAGAGTHRTAEYADFVATRL